MSTSEIREAIENVTELLSKQPQDAVSKSSATATLEDGLRCQITSQDEKATYTDMPLSVGGKDSAPNPGWFLRASLASCSATVIAMRAAQLGISLTTLAVTVYSESDTRGMLGINEDVTASLTGWKTQVKISASEASPEQLREIVLWAECHSPIGCTIRDAQAMSTEIEIT